MANYFRYAISKRIHNAIFKSEDKIHQFVGKCGPIIQISGKATDPPEVTLSWQTLSKECSIQQPLSKDVIYKINGNGITIPDGIIKVDSSENESIKVKINKDIFVKSVLKEISLNINSLRNTSYSLKSIKPSKIIFEYSSPNIAKPFHVGHVRSTILGSVLSNLYNYIGHEVTQINYLGDWGTQYGILTAGYKDLLTDSEDSDGPLHVLLNIYIAANTKAENDIEFREKAKDCFREMEAGNPELLSQWSEIRNLSLTEFNKVYSRLGVKFDSIEGESLYYQAARELLDTLLEQKLAVQTDDGAIEIELMGANGKVRHLPLLKRDQATLYITRDLAAAIKRKETYNFDKMFYVVDYRQKDHFHNLKSILEKMGHSWSRNLEHIPFGQIHGLSTRKGQIVYLDSLLDKAKKLALRSMEISPNTKEQEDPEKTAEILGISSIIINDLTVLRNSHYNFDWNRALHVKGDSGISLQYTHARLSSIERTFHKLFNVDCETELLIEPEAYNLVHHLSKFDEVLYNMHNELQPCILVKYLFGLSNLIGKANVVLPLKGTDRRLAEPRYLLFHTSKLVLSQALRILGIKPLDRM